LDDIKQKNKGMKYPMLNAVSIDVEYWYSGEPYSNYKTDNTEDQLQEAITPLLQILKENQILGTFFVLGIVAEQHPALVKHLVESGHEVASHGYTHKRVHQMNPKEFEQDIKKSISVLSSITGKQPIGYRAPSFSIDASTPWALQILKKNGFVYDSSVFPIQTHLYGEPAAPLEPYTPSMEDITTIDQSNEFIEFPLSVYTLLNTSIPVSGGMYFRRTPHVFLRHAITKINKTRPFIFYVHPWETYRHTPKVALPFQKKFFAYYGMKNALKKFERLMKEFTFTTIQHVLQEQGLL